LKTEKETFDHAEGDTGLLLRGGGELKRQGGDFGRGKKSSFPAGRELFWEP